MATTWETIAKSPSVSRRVAKHTPYDLRLAVGKRTFRRFPYNVRDGRGLIKHDKDPSAFIVKSGEGLGVPLRPRHHVDPPRPFMGAVPSEDCCCCQLKEVLGKE